MNTEPIADLERQIDHTRHALDRTMRALQFELSPRHQLNEAWRSAKVRTNRTMRASANCAVANPVPVTLGAVVLVAAACMLVSQRPRS